MVSKYYAKLTDFLEPDKDKPTTYTSAAADREFLRYGAEPQLLSSFYHSTPPVSAKSVSRTSLKRDEPERDFGLWTEQAFLAHRGEVPFGFLAGMHPDDIKLLADPVYGPMLNDILETQRSLRAHMESEKILEAQAQRLLEQQLSRGALQRAFPDAQTRMANFIDPTVLAEPDDAAREKTLEGFRQQVRDEAYGRAITTPDRELSLIEKGVQGLMGGMDWIMQEGLAYLHQSPLARVWDAVEADLGGDPNWHQNLYEWRGIGRIFGTPPGMMAPDPQQAAVSQQLSTEQLALNESRVMRQVEDLHSEVAWNVVQTQYPDEHAVWMGMAGGVEALAFALFSQAHRDQPEVKEQLSNWMEEQDWDDQAQLELLEEDDFGFTNKVVSGLAWYGKNVPMALATLFSQFVEDMYRSDASTDWSWDGVSEMLNRNNYSPAHVFGIENTVAGLAFDLGMGAAFDPLNLAFKPSGLGAARPYTAAAARRIATTGLARRQMDDIARLATDSTSNMSAAYRLISPFDSVGLGDEILDAVELSDQVYGGAAWRVADNRARAGAEIRLTTLRQLMDEEDVGMLAKISDETIDNTVTQLRGPTGPNKVAVVVYSVRTNTLHVIDGLPEILAAEKAGAHSYPTTVLVREYQRGKGVPAAGVLSSDEIARLGSGHQLSDRYLYHGSMEGDMTALNRGGLTPDFDSARGYAEAKTQRGTVGQPYVYAVRESDVPEGLVQAMNRQESLHGYSDIPSVSFAPEGAPNIPVAAVVGPGETWSPFVAEADTIAGGRYVRPDRVLPSRLIRGDATDMDRLYAVQEEAINMGMQSSGAGRTIMAQAATEEFRELLKSGAYGKMGQWLYRYAGRVFTSNRFATEGAAAWSSLMEIPYRIWGSDTVMADHFVGRLLHWRKSRRTADLAYTRAVADLAPLRQEVDALAALKGGAWDDTARLLQQEAAARAVFETSEREGLLNTLFGPEDARGGIEPHPAPSPGYTLQDAQRNLERWDELMSADDAPEQRQRLVEEVERMSQRERLGITDWDEYERSGFDPELREEMEIELSGDVGLSGDAVRTNASRMPAKEARARIVAEEQRQAMLMQQMDQAQANRLQVQEEFVRKNQQLRREVARIDDLRATQTNYGEFIAIMQNMYEEYNRRYIATNPIFKPFVDPATGLVPWDIIRLGLPPEGTVPVFPGMPGDLFTVKTTADNMAEFGNINAAARNLFDTPMMLDLPVSPMELVAARELGAAAYRRFTQMKIANGVRTGTLAVQAVWTIDKIMNIGVASGAALDEGVFMAMKHGVGVVIRRLEDLGVTIPARLAAARHGRFSPEHGMRHMPAGIQRRWGNLQNTTNAARQARQRLYEAHGYGMDDMLPDDRLYPQAAQVYTQRMIQNPIFQAMMEGKEAFRELYWGPEGRVLREQGRIDLGTMQSKLPDGPDQVFENLWNIFERVVLKEAAVQGKKAEMLAAFRSAVEQMRAGGNTLPVHFPDNLVPFLGPIRGARKMPGRRGPIARAMDFTLDHLFDRPADYRRAFLAEVIRAEETKRLVSLFTDQGKRIIPDNEVAQVLGMQGVDWVAMESLRPVLHQETFRSGYVMRSMIDELVDMKVEEAIRAETFSYDLARRAGGQAKLAFPFPRPWADFMGRWARETFTRPVLRGYLNESNFLGIRSLVDRMPINPKPLSFVSRIAATDFEVEGLWPGSPFEEEIESIDFSPLLFLPTANETNLSFLIPGMNWAPAMFADLLLPDPLENPLEYRQTVEFLGEFMPSLHFLGGDVATDMIGGGTFARAASLGFDVYGALSGRPYYEVTSYLGDISRDIARSREVRALLSDPETLRLITNIEDENELDLELREVGLEADRRASATHITESLTRLLSPVRAQYDDSVSDIHEVWISAAESFAELRPRRPLREGATAEEIASYANDVRSAWFELPQWRQDLLIAQKPEIAVNLIGSWEWTRDAIDTLGNRTATAYRTVGTPAGRAEHDALVDAGLVRPLSPHEMTRRILGLQYASRIAAAKHMYQFQAEYVNEILWEGNVTPDMKATLEQIAATPWAERIGIKDARQLWEQWESLRDEMEVEFPQEDGIPGMPQAMERWSSDFPGITGAPQRLSFLQFNYFTPETTEIAEALNIRLVPGMTGPDFYAAAQAEVANAQTPLVYQVTRQAYDDYVGERSVASNSNWQLLHEAAYDYKFSPEWRRTLQEFMLFVRNTEDDSVGAGSAQRDIPLALQQEVADRYWGIAASARDSNVPWNQIWEKRFASRFGPKDWEPPVPPPLVGEDGEPNPNAWQPFILEVVDGDTLFVAKAERPSWFGPDSGKHSVRLLGVNARELNQDGGLADTERLEDRLMDAYRQGLPIWLVRDPDVFGTRTDQYGRELAWLYIGDEPYYFVDDFRRHRDPARIEE